MGFVKSYLLVNVLWPSDCVVEKKSPNESRKPDIVTVWRKRCFLQLSEMKNYFLDPMSLVAVRQINKLNCAARL